MPTLEQQLVYDVINHSKKSIEHFSSFVETGTFEGDTSYMASQLFPNVYTIEVYEPLYTKACQRFQNTNVKVLFGDSLSILPTLLPTIKGNIIFWLDGHNSGAGTGVGKIDFPLLGECEIIDQNFNGEDAIIMIDDIRLFGQGHSAQIDNSLVTLTIDKVLQVFIKRSIVDYWLLPSNLSTQDRMVLHIH